ncbi:NTP transferase domain-containing protein [bacterium]|nr:NTP transferase domain-containing protein [bacterium]
MEPIDQVLQEISVAILCGGHGSRMRSNDQHKVCFPIDGVPAINRTIKMFRGLGAKKIFVVVGALASNVISTVGKEFPEVVFIYQHEQLGTGHAAQVAAAAIARLDCAGPLLITMGDKLIEPQVIREMAEQFVRARADMVFVTSPKKHKGLLSSAGRIVKDRSGAILGNMELRDIQRAQILESIAKLAGKPDREVPIEKAIEIGRRIIPDEKKLNNALWPLLEEWRSNGGMTGKKLLEKLGPKPGMIDLGGRKLTPDQVEKQSATVNSSVYLASRKFWDTFLPRLQNKNAQREFYLTDVINLAVADGKWKLAQHVLEDMTSVMAYNSPDELLRIEDIYRRKSIKSGVVEAAASEVRLPAGMYRPAAKWLEMFEEWPAALERQFVDIYGTEGIQSRRKLFVQALKLFISRMGGDRKCIIVRAPGRINLMGRHIDHRGGGINVMAIDRDVVFVAAPREDDVVRLMNADRKQFPDREFTLREALGDINWNDWLTYVNSDHVRNLISNSRGDWSNYVRASLVRLQQKFRTVRIHGFDAAVVGDIPRAAGLSSSSALVVASAEIAVMFNGLNVTPMELVDLCGEGEWFVGSRGGAGDHSAIRMSRRGQVSHVKFLPFRLTETYDFPADCKVIIAYSGYDARKSGGARDRFNQKVASYEFGLMLLKDRMPQYDRMLEQLRDLNPQRLGCTVSQIYRAMLNIPDSMSVAELRETLSDRHRQRLEVVLGSHQPPERYDLRGVVMFGVSECARSVLAPGLLSSGKLERFGELMAISHDGDRVSRHRRIADGRWRSTKYGYDCGEDSMLRRCDDLVSEDPDRVLGAQLYMQPGAYGCSIPQIDRMIDLVTDAPGVIGAQLGGAGLGGCIMILAHPSAVANVCDLLRREYYGPGKIEPLLHVCSPVAGAGAITM